MASIFRYNRPIDNRPILTGLLLFAALSPVLTALHLWQLKEWRWDRLREHMRREGAVLPLLGLSRPVVCALFCFGFTLRLLPLNLWTLWFLLALDVLTSIQFITKKQPLPVWTHKALTLFVTILILIGLVAFHLASNLTNLMANVFLPLLILLIPFFVLAAWLLWKPVDAVLKNRIIRQARAVRSRFPKLTVVGITGSVGKTTTKELLSHVLQSLKPLTTPAHVNSEIGVARWLVKSLPSPRGGRVGDGGDGGILIVEMGAYRRGEIALMSSYVQQTMAVVTAIGTQHLALFGSEQDLLAAKGEIVSHLPKNGHAFLNGDNDGCRQLIGRAACPVTTVGMKQDSNLIAADVEEKSDGLHFRIQRSQFFTPLHGIHNITNILLAIAVAKKLGLSDSEIQRQLATFVPPKKTFEVRTHNGVDILDDTHNSSASSFEAAITWAKSQPHNKKILLARGLIELGTTENDVHETLGALAADVFDEAIFIDPKSALAFQRGFGKKVTMIKQKTGRIEKGSLLVCVGRMSADQINRLLPS